MKQKLSVLLTLIFMSSFANAGYIHAKGYTFPEGNITFNGIIDHAVGSYNPGDYFSITFSFGYHQFRNRPDDDLVVFEGIVNFELNLAESQFHNIEPFPDHPPFSLFRGGTNDPNGSNISKSWTSPLLISGTGFGSESLTAVSYFTDLRTHESIALSFDDGNSISIIRPVPIPTAVLLFGSSLFCLFSFPRKKHLK